MNGKKSKKPLYKVIPEWVFILTGLTIVLGVITILAFWIQGRGDTVINERSVGTAINSVFSPSDWGSSTTTVTTDKGTYLVYGIFHVTKGNELFLEKRKGFSRMLCDRIDQECNKLVE